MFFVAVGCLLIPSVGFGGGSTPFPNVVLHSMDGQKNVRVEDFRGRPILLAFWASWCGPCRAELPELAELAHQLEDSGLVFLPVNVDSSAAAGLRFLQRTGIDVPAYRLSEKDHAMIGVRSLPTTILLDGEALPVQVFTGYSPTVVGAIRHLIEGMTGADSPSDRVSR